MGKKTISYRLGDLKSVMIPLGFMGENLYTQLIIDATEVYKDNPNAIVSLAVSPPRGEKYPAVVERDGNNVIWNITASDLIYDGNGEIQFTFTDDPMVRKSYKARISVNNSITPTGTVPTPIANFLTQASEALTACHEATTAAENAASKQPKIINDYWFVWDEETEQYVTTGIKAKGDKGDPGDPGSPGDPTLLIDDTTPSSNKTFSSSKIDTELGGVKSAIQLLDTNAVRYVGSRTFRVGENLLTGETSFSGTGWSGSLANGFTHATGNTDPLVFAAETVNGQAYIIDYDYTGDIGGDNMFVTIGDMPKVDVYHGAIRPFVGIISDGGYLKISCKSTYTGTIKNLKIRPVLASGGTEVTFECAEITNGQNPYEISSWHVVAIGRDVLSKNVNGTRTVAIGDRALEKIITGHRNIAIGPYAMPFVTEGDCNVSIGADTLYNPSYNTGESKAYSNVAIGKGTMLNGQLVQNNIAIGHGSMGANDVNAEENVCVGRQAGYNTKKRNTFIGHRAGYYYNGDAGINNVCVGTDAGFNAYHNGQNNVFIGAEARAEVPGASASTTKTCSNSIVIGKGSKATASFQIVIGNANHTLVKIAGKTLVFNQDGTVTWE